MLCFIVNAVLTAAIFYNIHHSFKLTDKKIKRFYKHYFIVMALLLSIDNVFSFILYRIPYYQIFKLTLLAWLSVPNSTGPHFIYNVYIRNIHKLFEGDIDAVILNLKGYVEQVKAKYHEIVNSSKKGEIEIGFTEDKSLKAKIQACSSSEIETTNSVISNDEETLKK